MRPSNPIIFFLWCVSNFLYFLPSSAASRIHPAVLFISLIRGHSRMIQNTGISIRLLLWYRVLDWYFLELPIEYSSATKSARHKSVTDQVRDCLNAMDLAYNIVEYWHCVNLNPVYWQLVELGTLVCSSFKNIFFPWLTSNLWYSILSQCTVDLKGQM